MRELNFTNNPVFVFNICLPHSTFYWVSYLLGTAVFATLAYWNLISLRCANTRPHQFFSPVISNMWEWVLFDASLGRLPWFLGTYRESEVHSRQVHIFNPISTLPLLPLSACVRPWPEALGTQCRGGILRFFTPKVQATPFCVLLWGRSKWKMAESFFDSPMVVMVLPTLWCPQWGACMSSALTVSDACTLGPADCTPVLLVGSVSCWQPPDGEGRQRRQWRHVSLSYHLPHPWETPIFCPMEAS